MSSITQSEFITELKLRSAIIAEMDDADIASFIAVALRAYSAKDPYELVSADNDVVVDQDEYSLPSGCIKVTDVVDSANNEPIRFSVVDNDGGKVIKLGNKLQRSYSDLLQGTYYANPLHQSSAASYSYTQFDIYYVILQTLTSIDESALEVLTFYIEYLSYLQKANTISTQIAAAAEAGGEPVSITESDSTGASTSVSFGSKSSSEKLRESLKESADESLKRFNDHFNVIAYGTRG